MFDIIGIVQFFQRLSD